MKDTQIQKYIKPSINKISKYISGGVSNKLGTDFIKLSSNESPFEVPKSVYKDISLYLRKSNLYPDGDSILLKKTIAKELKLDSNQIICGNGSDDILSIVAQTFCREKGEVICSEFGFIYYPIISRASGANVVIAKSKNLAISCDEILKKINSKTNVIFIANPNNPTGTILSRSEIVSFLKKVPSKTIVVLDCAYAEFVEDQNYSDGTDLISEFSNLIITRTFSKIFGLAALRLGWAYSNKEIINLLEKIRGPFNVNGIAQIVGANIFKEKKFLKTSIKHNNEWKQKLPASINRINGLIAYETNANFVLVKANSIKKKGDIIKYLFKKKILVRDLSNYNLNEFFRVSIGKKEHLNKFINELKYFMKKNEKKF